MPSSRFPEGSPAARAASTLEVPPTYFAPARREPLEAILAQHQAIARRSEFVSLLEALPHPVVVLGALRQIVFANAAFLGLTASRLPTDPVEGGRPRGGHVLDDVLGSRPGEALGCRYAEVEAGGCGTSRFCRECEAVQTILSSQAGVSAVQECSISLESGEALDIEVHARPLELDDRSYTMFTVIDRSDEKRRRTLERIFFHDVLNSAGGLVGFAELLAHLPSSDDTKACARAIARLAESIVEEIRAQRDLLAAESHELELHPQPFNPADLAEQVAHLYRTVGLTRQRKVAVEVEPETLLCTDMLALRRVLSNMLKNAIEATGPADEIVVSGAARDDGFVFSVYNPGVIPTDVALRIFKRSFSTKGEGRGLGTYSIRLIGEKWLKGRVWFTSSVLDGTTFSIWVPNLPARPIEGDRPQT
jgi:signal transduction histidine kinase